MLLLDLLYRLTDRADQRLDLINLKGGWIGVSEVCFRACNGYIRLQILLSLTKESFANLDAQINFFKASTLSDKTKLTSRSV